jgi:hypothetical protein
VPFLTPGSGMGKKSRSESGMNIPYHISKSIETIFWLKKILKFFDADLGSEIFLTLDPGFGVEKFGSGINIPDPHHWLGPFCPIGSKRA